MRSSDILKSAKNGFQMPASQANLIFSYKLRAVVKATALYLFIPRRPKHKAAESLSGRWQEHRIVLHHEEVPAVRRGGDLQQRDIQLLKHIHIRHDGNTESGGDKSGDDLVLLGFDEAFRLPADLLVHPVDDLPQT